MKDIFSFDFRESIRKVVRRELKEKFGVKPSKEKTKIQPSQDCQSCLFGVSLENVPSKGVKDDQYCNIPVFLVDAFEYLNNHFKVEGLFRKSGSVGRQKVLRELLEKDGTCCECEFVQPHDIASLVKQFFRELPDPLLTARLSPAFLKCASLTDTNESISALALCCLLLPDVHLRVFKYFIKFISEMANHSLESKMTLSNLAIVFAPNLVGTSGKDKNSEKSMKETTQVVDLLFKNPHLIGMVPDALLNKAMNLNQDDGGFLSSSGDELEAGLDENFKRGRTLQRSEKKRDRSKSITGFLRRNFKQGDKSAPKHGRSRTCEKPVPPNTEGGNDKSVPIVTVKEFGEPIWKNQLDRPVKRRNSSKTNMSPVRKSPRLSHKEHQAVPVISLPKMKSVSNQVASTPRRLLQPVQNYNHDKPDGKSKSSRSESTRVLPSKFNFSRTQQQQQQQQQLNNTPDAYRTAVHSSKGNRPVLSRSKSSADHFPHSGQPHFDASSSLEENGNEVVPSSVATTHNNDGNQTDQQQQHIPQPKISRATQKPHVRKSRRTSSLDRRRARYASSTKIRRQLPKCPDEKTLIEDPTLTSQNDSSAVLKTVESNTNKIEKNSLSRENNNTNIDAGTSVNLKITTTATTTRIRRRLPKASSYGNCQSPNTSTTNENQSPVTPTNKRLLRSSTSVRKPGTPYNVTPQIGTRRTKPLPPMVL